jgi:hypothetical protein
MKWWIEDKNDLRGFYLHIGDGKPIYFQFVWEGEIERIVKAHNRRRHEKQIETQD